MEDSSPPHPGRESELVAEDMAVPTGGREVHWAVLSQSLSVVSKWEPVSRRLPPGVPTKFSGC